MTLGLGLPCRIDQYDAETRLIPDHVFVALGGFFEWIAARIVKYAHAPASLFAVVVTVSVAPGVQSGSGSAPRTAHPDVFERT